MITSIHLEALKCFDILTLPTASLTLLTGFNAAGKSTALQAPLLVAQALRGDHKARRLSLNGPLVQLGTLGEVIYEASKELGRRQLVLGVKDESAEMAWCFKSEERGANTSVGISSVELADRRGPRTINATNGDLLELVPIPRPSAAIKKLIDSLKSIVFISAVRDGAREIFPSPEASEPVHADVGVRGEFAPWWFAEFLDDEVPIARRHKEEAGTTLRRQVGAWASQMFPGAEANAQFLEKTGLVQLQLRTRITDDWRRPANIGYGLTYAFPILVSALLARPGQVLIVDSPEAHLHPRAQSAMGMFLASMAAAGTQLLIETHSDHVLNGVRLAVSHGTLKPEAAIVHFFTGSLGAHRNEQDIASVISAHIDRSGGVDLWPEGFFDQAERDLAALAGWK